MTKKNADHEIGHLFEAIRTGAMGLSLKAMMKEGQTAALAHLDHIERGQAHLELMVRITRAGVTVSGSYCSHGENLPLFTLTQQHSPNTPTH